MESLNFKDCVLIFMEKEKLFKLNKNHERFKYNNI